jgi:succinate dehydrogenase/fumarate reductase flavoprotein subunit
VGFGGAGIAAAITAHDAGAKVLILEKQAADTKTTTHHTPNTRMCGGLWLCPTDIDAAVEYFESMAQVANETLTGERRDIIRTLAQHLFENDGWMRQMGVEWVEAKEDLGSAWTSVLDLVEFSKDGRLLLPDYPELPGSKCMTLRVPRQTGQFRDGAVVFKSLSDAIAKRGIQVLWQTPARELIFESGEVRGVAVQSEGKRLAIKASRAVVLACGGFEFNEWMKENYLRVHPSYFYGSKANTGDGVNMAINVGAALWHMNCVSWRAVMKTPEFNFSFAPLLELGGIFIDKKGNRFTREIVRGHAFGYDLTAFESMSLRYPRIPFYWIFDEKRMQAGPLATQHGACNPPGGIPGPDFYVWSKNNQIELDKGWFTEAMNFSELAKKIAQDPDNQGMLSTSTLRKTICIYNNSCRLGKDSEFHRPQFTLTPLADPPYYVVKLWPGSTATHGGPKRNYRAQVLDAADNPIPRLYSCGELGSYWGMLTTSGGGIGECFASGRIAGANSITEKRWQ